MGISILAECHRCERQFIIKVKAGDQVLPLSSKDKVHFKDDNELRRLQYVRSMTIGEYDHLVMVTGETVVFCKKCDQEYWHNFGDAVKVLESFWHEPIKGEL